MLFASFIGWGVVIVVVALVFAISYGLTVTGVITLPKRKPKPTAKDNLQKAIDDKTAALTAAQKALDASESDLRSKDRGVKQSENDITQLNSKLQTAIAEDDNGQQVRLMKRLMAEEAELEDKTEAYNKAIERHNGYEGAIATNRREIKELKDSARQSAITLNLAEADAAFRKSDGEASSAAAQFKRQAASADARVVKPQVDEFTQAAEDAEIQERLAAMKKGN